jgi:hypothetical protein
VVEVVEVKDIERVNIRSKKIELIKGILCMLFTLSTGSTENEKEMR